MILLIAMTLEELPLETILSVKEIRETLDAVCEYEQQTATIHVCFSGIYGVGELIGIDDFPQVQQRLRLFLNCLAVQRGMFVSA